MKALLVAMPFIFATGLMAKKYLRFQSAPTMQAECTARRDKAEAELAEQESRHIIRDDSRRRRPFLDGIPHVAMIISPPMSA